MTLEHNQSFVEGPHATNSKLQLHLIAETLPQLILSELYANKIKANGIKLSLRKDFKPNGTDKIFAYLELSSRNFAGTLLSSRPNTKLIKGVKRLLRE